MIQGILFDMDGVLFDTERMSMTLGDEVAREMGCRLDIGLAPQICGASSAAARGVLQKAIGPGFDYDVFAARLAQRMQDEMALNGVPKKPGVDELLAHLKQKGYCVAVASSTFAPEVHKLLAGAGIAHHFAAVVGGDMVPHTKPAPDIFLRAAAELGLAPAACLAIEDSANGVISASEAGCTVVMVPDLFPPTDEVRRRCAAVLASLHEIPAFLERLQQ